MRDLAARLRNIVRQDREVQARAARELTYVAPDLGDPGVSHSVDRVAEALGGVVHETQGSACAVLDKTWESYDVHGRRPVSSYAPEAGAPIGLFDPRAAALADWASGVVFFDVETTGLSGGAGTLAFLAGCGWFEDGAFKVRQFLLPAASGERAMLDALGAIFDAATLVVTFNGRTFDLPLMETRWAFHRTSSPTDDLPHFDVLPPARRLWGRTGRKDVGRLFPDGFQCGEKTPDVFSCSLTSLEKSVLGFHRLGDVAGFEIPARYFQFLRTGEASLIEAVLEHNRLDLLSTAAVMSQALWLAQEGPEACREAGERLALGRLYERAGDGERAERAFEMAAREGQGDREIRRHALARLAILRRRQERHEESAAAWQQLLMLTDRRRRESDPLRRRAAEALAIHHEHRARDLKSARRYAEALRTDATGRARAEADHRLGRIDRKLEAQAPPSGAQELDWEQ
jgi:uncharacterized protein YprB with RNaseH-like and TPR domain